MYYVGYIEQISSSPRYSSSCKRTVREGQIKHTKNIYLGESQQPSSASGGYSDR